LKKVSQATMDNNDFVKEVVKAILSSTRNAEEALNARKAEEARNARKAEEAREAREARVGKKYADAELPVTIVKPRK
jgi:hypothetical protein